MIEEAHKVLVALGMDNDTSFVAKMVLLGFRDREIAERIGKSERTAKRWVGKALQIAKATSRAQLWPIAMALLEDTTLHRYRTEHLPRR